MEILASKIREVYKKLQDYHSWKFPTVLVEDGFIGGKKSLQGISDGEDGQMFLAGEPDADRWQWHSLTMLLPIIAQLDQRRIPKDCIVYADADASKDSKRIIDLDKTIEASNNLINKDPNALSQKYSYNHIDYFKELPKVLDKKMAKADWYYEYTDDHSVWQRGVLEIKGIIKDLEKLAKTEHGFEISKGLWEKHVPEYSVPKPDFLDDDTFYSKKLYVMTDKEISHIRQQFRHIGAAKAFTPELVEQLKAGVPEKTHSYQFDSNGDKAEAAFYLKKGKDSNLYFLNKYDMTVNFTTTNKTVTETFYVSGQDNVQLKEGEKKLNNVNRFTIKKAANYLAGRPVYNAFSDKEGNQYEAWAKRKFNVEKGKFEMVKYRKEYPFSLDEATKNYSIKDLATPEYKERVMESYKRGNLQKVTFVGQGGQEEQLYTSLQIGLVAGGSLDVYDLNKDRVPLEKLVEKGFVGKDFAQQINERLSQKQQETVKESIGPNGASVNTEEKEKHVHRPKIS